MGSLMEFCVYVIVGVENRSLRLDTMYLTQSKARAVEDVVVGINHLLRSRQAINVPIDIIVLQDATIHKLAVASLESLFSADSLARLILAHV